MTNPHDKDVQTATAKFLRGVIGRVCVRALEIDRFDPSDPETKELLDKAEISLTYAISQGLDAGIEAEREECARLAEVYPYSTTDQLAKLIRQRGKT